MPVREPAALLFRRDECVLGEGPFWHASRLWWVDIERGLLQSVDERGDAIEEVSFGERCGAAVPAGPDHFLVALERRIVKLQWSSKTWDTVAEPKELAADSRFNDGKCDPRGRFMVGTMSPDGCRDDAALYALGPHLALRHLRGGLSISNGLAWSVEGTTFYLIDTPKACVVAIDYDPASGNLGRERICLQFSPDDGWPDGMTIDRAGRLWIGFWDGWAVRCYHPATGNCEAVVRVPCARVTSCCFGGPNLDRLYITTARRGLDPDTLLQQPLAGSLFICGPGVEGYPTAEFASAPKINSI